METLETDSVLAIVAIIFAVLMAARAWQHGALSGIRALSGWVAGVAAGIWSLQNGNALLSEYTGVEIGPIAAFFTSIGLAVVMFALVRFLIRMFLNDVFGDQGPLAGYFRGPLGALVSLLPSSAFIIFFCLMLRWAGTNIELSQIDRAAAATVAMTEENYPKAHGMTHWRNAVERWPYAVPVLDYVDPVSGLAKRNLVAILLASNNSDIRLALRNRKSTSWIANHPGVVALVENDPELQRIVEGGHAKYLRLLLHSRVQGALRDDKLREKLAEVDMPAEIKEIVTGSPLDKRKSWLQRIFSKG